MKARLDGHEYDLQDLADWLPTGSLCVAKDDEGFYLTATVIDNPPEGTTFYEAAHGALNVVNGLGRVNRSTFRPVRLNGRFHEGDQRHAVVAATTVETRVRISAAAVVADSAGQVKPNPLAPGTAYATLATGQPDVAEALTILAAEHLGWVEMYKVFEIVRDSVKPTRLDQSGLLGQSRLAARLQISAFTSSANRPDVSGGYARHARMDGAAPRRTMTEADGRQFITHLVRTWMDAHK